MCAITLENKHRGTWGVWRHLLAFLDWQHRVALQHFHVEKHYLAHESLLWVTLLPFKQWEVRTVTKLTTCFIRTGHCSTSWRGKKGFQRNNWKWKLDIWMDQQLVSLLWHLHPNKGHKRFFLVFLQGRDGKRALFVYSFALELREHKVTWQLPVLIQGSGSSHWELFAPLIAHVRSKPAHGSAYFPLLSV